MNGHVRRLFNLEAFVEVIDGYSYEDTSGVGEESSINQRNPTVETGMERVRLLPKKQLMRKLEEFDNLINAMGALFYASKRM